ncbi:hypothetical protein HN51_043030 [Arachis hypogaea]
MLHYGIIWDMIVSRSFVDHELYNQIDAYREADIDTFPEYDKWKEGVEVTGGGARRVKPLLLPLLLPLSCLAIMLPLISAALFLVLFQNHAKFVIVYREWKWHVSSKKNADSPKNGKQRSLMRLVTLHWPFSWMRSRLDEINNKNINSKSSLPSDSMMTWYLPIETGNFWLHYWLLLICHVMMLSLAMSR